MARAALAPRPEPGVGLIYSRESFTTVPATPGQEHVPPVLILVCDNTDIAEAFYRKISGETEMETVTEAEVAEVLAEDDDENGSGSVAPKKAKSGKSKMQTVYGRGAIFPEYFSNTPV